MASWLSILTQRFCVAAIVRIASKAFLVNVWASSITIVSISKLFIPSVWPVHVLDRFVSWRSLISMENGGMCGGQHVVLTTGGQVCTGHAFWIVYVVAVSGGWWGG